MSPSSVDAIDLEHDVAGLEPGLHGRRLVDRRDDHEVAVRPERGAVAGVAVRIDRADLRADALERAGDVVERALEVLRAEVGRVRVADGLDQAADRTLDQGAPIDRDRAGSAS